MQNILCQSDISVRYKVMVLDKNGWKYHDSFDDLETAKQIVWILRDLKKFLDVDIKIDKS